MNPETLINAPMITSFHRSRHGHVEGKRSTGRLMKILMDNIREDLKEKNIDGTRIGEVNRKRGLDEPCKSLIVSTLMEEREKEDRSRI